MLVLIPRIGNRVRRRLSNPLPRLRSAALALARLPVLLLWGLPRRGLAWVWWWICAQGLILRQSPRQAYVLMSARRDWVIARVEYAHGESAKYRALWSIAKFPYTALRACGLNAQSAIAVLAIGSTAGTAVVANEMLAAPSFSAGDHGTYTAPSDVPVVYSDSNNTLRIDLGTTSVGEILIENVTVGTAYADSALPDGQVNVVMVGGTASSAGFLETFIEIGHLTIDRTRCTQLTIENSETHTLNIHYNASDGQSIAPVAGTPRARAIGGGNRAASMVTSGGTYDQIRIGAPTSGVDGQVDVLRLSNLLTSGGPCVVSRVKAGTIDILYNEIGAGDGFASKDFVVATTTIAQIISIVDNVEEDISPP
jgi:hypothetical protein